MAALFRALPVFFSTRMLWLVFAPLAGAAMAWGLVTWLVWAPLSVWLSGVLFNSTSGLGVLTARVLALLLLTLVAALTALVAIAVLAMPAIVGWVAARDFPELERRRGGTFAGSVVNAAGTVAMFMPLWLLSLATLFLPPLFLAITLMLNAWLNQRMFRYDALALHADRDELGAVMRSARGRLFRLGLVLAPLSLVPFVNLLAPLYAGVAFSYLCLDELTLLRARGHSG